MMTPKDIRALRNNITEHFMLGRFVEGVTLLEQKEAELPEAVRLECRGNLHFYRHELQEAITNYEMAITVDPDYYIARYQYLVGVQNETHGDFVAAFKRYQNAIEIEPTFVDAYVELGGLLGKAADLEGAARCYRDAARLNPNDLGVLHNLKSVLTQLANAEPHKYGQELSATETACDELTKRGAKLPDKRQW